MKVNLCLHFASSVASGSDVTYFITVANFSYNFCAFGGLQYKANEDIGSLLPAVVSFGDQFRSTRQKMSYT